MRIGLEDIDSDIAAALQDRLCAPMNEFLREPIHWGGLFPWRLNLQWQSGGLKLERKRNPSEDEKFALEVRKKRDEALGWRAVGAATVPPLLASLMFGALRVVGMDDIASGMTALTSWFAATGGGVWWTLKAIPQRRLRKAVTLEEMRAVFPLLSLTRAERIYCDALLMLGRTEADENAEKILRETLRQINELLRNYKLMESRRQSLLPVLGLNAIPDLEREFGELGQRMDQTNDPIMRQSLQQSLAMCQQRLESARQLHQSLERLNAQQEAIIQTLASALSAMARLQAAPSLTAGATAQEISASVSQMNQQTYAVEQAVEEVLTLRSS